MKQDIFGQMNSLRHSATVQDWDAALMGFLAHAAVTPEHLGRTLSAEPDFALGHAVKGLFTLLMGRRELVPAARAALDDARRGAEGGISRRETLYLAALSDWLAGRPSSSVQRLEQVLRANPGDALAMKLSHAIRFVLGNSAGMRRSIERVLPAYGTDHPGHGYLLGCHAFALEETGAYDRAETTGRQALWTAPDDAWGLHAVAHVHDMRGDAERGLGWLEGREAAWAHCNNFRYHVWWHKALMHLDLGQVDTVLALYDAEIRKDRTDDYRDISNAASLLTRLELDGVDVGARWDELAELSAARTEDGSLIFADLHYMLALVGGDRPEAAALLLARMHRDAGRGGTEADARMADPGLAAAAGLEAFGETRFDAAATHLLKARPAMQLAGGSHAQRDVFERLTIDALIRAGRLDEAERVLDERSTLRAGRDDGYAAVRRDLIAAGRGAPAVQSVSAH